MRFTIRSAVCPNSDRASQEAKNTGEHLSPVSSQPTQARTGWQVFPEGSSTFRIFPPALSDFTMSRQCLIAKILRRIFAGSFAKKRGFSLTHGGYAAAKPLRVL